MQDCFSFLSHRVTLRSDGTILLENQLTGSTIPLTQESIATWTCPLYSAQRERKIGGNITVTHDSDNYCTLRIGERYYVMPYALFCILNKALLIIKVYPLSTLNLTLSNLLYRLSKGASTSSLIQPPSHALPIAV